MTWWLMPKQMRRDIWSSAMRWAIFRVHAEAEVAQMNRLFAKHGLSLLPENFPVHEEESAS